MTIEIPDPKFKVGDKIFVPSQYGKQIHEGIVDIVQIDIRKNQFSPDAPSVWKDKSDLFDMSVHIMYHAKGILDHRNYEHNCFASWDEAMASETKKYKNGDT